VSAHSDDIAETKAVKQLSAALAEAFKPGGLLDGYGFALWIIPPEERGTSAALLSNTPRQRVADTVAGWMLRSGYAMAVPVPPDAPQKSN
jgi:hypothetical protein